MDDRSSRNKVFFMKFDCLGKLIANMILILCGVIIFTTMWHKNIYLHH